jgi:other hect domain ubiquitin protein ligase E3
MLLGNVVQADFSPSGQARNEHSLNRWGFKISIRPVYGLKHAAYKDILSEEKYHDMVNRFGS